MIDELTHALEIANVGTPEQSVESAIMIYLAAQAEIERFVKLQAEAKALITDVMTETGKTRYATKCGTVAISSSGQSVSYDAKALDVLCNTMPNLAEVLEMHRKVTERPGTMRITGAK